MSQTSDKPIEPDAVIEICNTSQSARHHDYGSENGCAQAGRLLPVSEHKRSKASVTTTQNVV